MSTPLAPPWSGLATVAPRLDLWPILRALGGHAASASPAEWAAAGLPLGCLPALTLPGWAAAGLHAGGAPWPAQLDDLPHGPVALSAEGNLTLLARPMVAIVGTRRCTAYGREWAARLARAVAGAGGVVVSGLAAGIDAEAHEGSDGATVAVLGQGLASPMPRWQTALRDRLLARGGLVLSELAPPTRADRFTFPVRNRIVAGLAQVVVVVEARHRSGAKNTVWHALRYGRDVFAVPGPLGAEASEGCHDLLAEGAGIVRSEATVLAAVGLRPASTPGDRLLAALAGGATPEAVALATRLPLADVYAALGALELERRVVRLPGRRYVATPG